MDKKRIGLLGILVAAFFGMVVQVYAQEDLLSEWLRFIFVDLSDLAQSGDQAFIIYSKMILFLLIFVVLYWSTEKVFKEKERIAGTVAFIVALISVVMLPGEIILLIFQTYSTIIGFAFVLLPVIIGLVLAYKFANKKEGGHPHLKKILKGIIFVVIAIMTFSLSATLAASGSDIYVEVAKWAKIGGVIALLVGIFYLITFWGGGEKEGAPPKG
jgi:hypothetical protein